jgi:hypothetical protein
MFERVKLYSATRRKPPSPVPKGRELVLTAALSTNSRPFRARAARNTRAARCAQRTKSCATAVTTTNTSPAMGAATSCAVSKESIPLLQSRGFVRTSVARGKRGQPSEVSACRATALHGATVMVTDPSAATVTELPPITSE